MRLESVEGLAELVATGGLPTAGLLVVPELEEARPYVELIATELEAVRYDIVDPSSAALREMQTDALLLTTVRLYVIWDAQRMNRTSQITLLKVVEEPPPLARFLLVTTDMLGVYDVLRARLWEWFVPYQPSGDVWGEIWGRASEEKRVAALGGEALWALAQDVAQKLERAALVNVFAISRRVTAEQYVVFVKLLAVAWRNQLQAGDGRAAMWARGLEYIQHHAYLLMHTEGQVDRLFETLLLKLWMGARYGFDHIPKVPGVW